MVQTSSGEGAEIGDITFLVSVAGIIKISLI